jgi:hypothetical protein
MDNRAEVVTDDDKARPGARDQSFLGLPWGDEQITPRLVGDQAQSSGPDTTYKP